MILAGGLDDFSLPDILQLLMQQRKSGVLRLSRNREKAEIFISQGNVTGVRVGNKTPETKIQDMLVESGRIERKDFLQMRELSESMNRSLMATLSAKGYFSEEEKESWLSTAAEDMVCDLFAWTDGEYAFDAQQKATPGAPLHISTDFACMEGMRRIDEWGRLKEILPHEEMVFKPTGRPLESEVTGYEQWVLEILDGEKNLLKLEKELPFGSFRLYEILAQLWNSGHILAEDAPLPGNETKLPVSVQSEKDQKTALLLGTAALIFLMTLLFRFAAMSFLATDGAGDYSAVIHQRLQAENVEIFVVDFAARRDRLPEDLLEMEKEKILTREELKKRGGRYFVYEKYETGEFTIK